MSGAKEWLRHPTAILLAAIAYAVHYEGVFWTLLLGSMAMQLLDHRFLGLLLGLLTIVVGSAKLGTMLEQHGITTHLRNKSKR